MRTLAERLREHWRSIGVRIRSGVSQQEIDTFEFTYGVCLSEEALSYFRAVDGMEEGDSDEELLRFLPLHKLTSVPETLAAFGGIPDYRNIVHVLPGAELCFIFIDYLIYSHVYALRLSPERSEESPVLWICGADYRVIAASLSEFLETYLADPIGVLFPHDL